MSLYWHPKALRKGNNAELLNDHTKDYRPLPSVAVILPVLDEATNLQRLTKEIRELECEPDEIIVVDGGSTDETIAVAQSFGLKLISTHRGRGHQILTGLYSAESDIILVLHADMVIEDEVISKIKQTMIDQSIPGGAIGNRFVGSSGFMKFVALLNFLRARYYGISFGDQGQFFWRQQATHLNWVVAFPVMEDIELSVRMKKAGRPLYLNGGIMSSTRRWEKHNKLFNFFRLLHFIVRFYFASEKHKPQVAKRIYQEYYHEDLPDTL